MGRLNRGSSFFVTGLALALISLVMLTSCSKDSGDAAPEQDRTLVLPLSSFYTGNGDKWNDYILNDGADIFSASNTAAVGNESGYYTALIHAAELKVVSVTGKTTCTDLTASDGLNAFDWVCDESTSPVRFKSTGLAANKHLSDLINFTAGTWKPNQVTVLDNGATYARTASAAWWTNTVTVDNDGTDGSDLVAGEIRLVTTDPVTATYTINTNRVSLLVDPAISLSNPTASATVYLNTASFLWFEGHLDVSKNSSLIGLQTNSVTFSVVRNMRLSSSNNVNQTGMQISSSSALRISDVSSENVDTAIGVDGSYNVFSDLTLKNGVSGIVMTGASATNNRVSRLTLSNFSTSCVSISGSAKQNVFQDIYGGKCGSIGFMIANANRNIVSRATINNSSTGLSLSFGGDNIISQFTSTNNSTCIQLASSNNVIMASTTSHCQSYGIQMMNSGNTIDRVASTNHSGTGLQLDTISQATIVDF
ncbi:MAG: right-handed parallel beta-helix repeat-containing protein, partial [Gammaproteobacteria bacterium]|nr:right-handed parallel beta-helix repeat-containing protein [Gammaproteobacteria bacterium]